jgi:hypothetical protein
MKTVEDRVFLAIGLIGLVYFLVFLPINAQGARDLNMLSVFSPDEFGQYPHLQRMLNQPADSFLGSIYRFIQYKHYYYGFPFFLFSTLAILPLIPFVGAGDISLNLLLLRQLVSVLPMLIGIGSLVYMQTGFKRTAQAILLYFFMLTIPMVMMNNLWWHPESPVFLFVVLTFFFLQRDNLEFGRDFKLAAIACGLATATKLIGLFFFLAIPGYLFFGWRRDRLAIGRIGILAAQFLALMTLTFLISNPFLLFESEREAAFKIQSNQSEATASGFVFTGDKSPASWLPVLEANYAEIPFLGLSLIALILGIADRQTRLLFLLILLWVLPFSIYLFFFVALRHKYYFMPVVLPLVSTLPVLMVKIPPTVQCGKARFLRLLATVLVFSLVGIQAVKNLQFSAGLVYDQWYKESRSESLKFFSTVERNFLSKINLDRKLFILRDVRVYISADPRWEVRHRWGLIHYGYIERTKPDVIALWKQQVYDYTNTAVAESAVKPESLAEALPFYNDARNGQIQGYSLVYEDDFGLFFLSDSLVDELTH